MRTQPVTVFIAFVGVIAFLCSPVLAAPPTHTISGIVATDDGTGIEGIDVVGDNGATTAVTAADGSYSITVSNHWDGTITVSKTGWLITPASNTYTNVSADIQGQDYTAYQPTISGTVKKADGASLVGATVAANNGGGSSVSDASGYYELYVPYNWTGTVSATFAGYHFTDKNYTNLTTNQTDQNFSGYQPTISGYVKKSDGTALEGAGVTAGNGGGLDTTDASGYYEIIVPYDWTGTASATLSGYGFTDKNYTNVTTDQTNQNFGGYQPTISGSTGVAGATVT